MALGEAGIQVTNLRVRDLGDHASLEVDVEKVAEVRALDSVREALMSAGFPAADVDPRGFRSGSMNELLPEPERYR
jgi:uncharacterized protein